jgi:hypothetical protein
LFPITKSVGMNLMHLCCQQWFMGLEGSVIAQEYNESWLVTSVISADTCDCVYPWSAPWWTHSSPCALNYIFYQLFEAELLHWHWQLLNWGGHLFSLFINR